MKFGRFHGLILMLLGLIMMIGQAIVSFYSHSTVPGAPTSQSSPALTEKPAIPPIFGIMGGLSFGAGLIILITSPKKSLEQEVPEPGKR
jgi:hypothetical protein